MDAPLAKSSKTYPVDKSSDRVRDMFAQIAGKYDLMNHVLSANVDRYWRRATVQRVPAIGTDPILDLCTGTGDLALEYWKSTGGNVPIVGADFCHEMLRVAREKQTRRKAEGINFVEASAMNLPFDDDLFQIVAVAFGLRNVEDTEMGLREIVRVCRPGGRVAVLEFSKPAKQPLKSIYSFYFRNILPRVGQYMARNDKAAYEYLPSSVGTFPSGQDLADRLGTIGLNDVEFIPMTFGIATLYTGVK